MSSANDNFTVRDGADAPFKLRSKDVSVLQDGSLQFARHLASFYPVDYGAGGSFRLTSKSGIMAAGLAANSSIYSFRWTSTTFLALIRRIRLQMWSLGTGFTAGIGTFDLFRATAWTAADTGGTTDTLTGDNGNLRLSMAGSALPELRHSSTAALTAGTRTLDAQPAESLNFGVSTALQTLMNPGSTKLFEALQGEHPLVHTGVSAVEGFTIRATVPATGTWTWAITTEWDEVPIVT